MKAWMRVILMTSLAAGTANNITLSQLDDFVGPVAVQPLRGRIPAQGKRLVRQRLRSPGLRREELRRLQEGGDPIPRHAEAAHPGVDFHVHPESAAAAAGRTSSSPYGSASGPLTRIVVPRPGVATPLGTRTTMPPVESARACTLPKWSVR